MVKSPAWLYSMRSEQLSIVYLTRRDDLRVIQPKHEYTPNLLVTLLENGRDAAHYMGVEAQGVSADAVRHASKRNQDNAEIARLRVDYAAYQDIPFPVCLFVFSMEDSRGYWKWIREPIFDAQGSGSLASNESKTLFPLTNDTVEQAVQTVRCWYEKVK